VSGIPIDDKAERHSAHRFAHHVADPKSRAELVKRHARAVGFDLVGITGTSVPEGYARYLRAMQAGYGANMEWLTEDPWLREDVRNVWVEARSVVVGALSYASGVPGYMRPPAGAFEGWVMASLPLVRRQTSHV